MFDNPYDYMNNYFVTTLEIKKKLHLESIFFDYSKLQNDGYFYWDYYELNYALSQALNVKNFIITCKDGPYY